MEFLPNNANKMLSVYLPYKIFCSTTFSVIRVWTFWLHSALQYVKHMLC